MKKMAAILAVLMTAVMVMGMTASAEAVTFRPENRPTQVLTITGGADTGKWTASAPAAVTISNSEDVVIYGYNGAFYHTCYILLR